MKEVNKEIKKIKHKFTETSEPKVLFKGRLKYNPNSRKISLVLTNHLEAMTFYGDDFRNMLGLEKANDPGDLTIKFEEKMSCVPQENIIMNFQNRAPLIIRVLTCTCTPAW